MTGGEAPAARTAEQVASRPVGEGRPSAGVLVLTLDRPQTRNALSLAMLGALREAVVRAGGDNTVAAIIIAANGPVFSSGHDLKELESHRGDADGGRAFFDQVLAACSATMQAIVACPKPVIAAVEGTATAAGCQLVATADLAVASQTAQFCTPGVNIGLFCSTPMVALSRDVPRKRAMEMLLLGEMISAEDAERFGLVNRVVPPGSALGAAQAMAERIASKSPLTLAVGKRAFYEQIEMGLAEAYDHASRVMLENMMARDAAEGIGAFLAKRAPVWTGC